MKTTGIALFIFLGTLTTSAAQEGPDWDIYNIEKIVGTDGGGHTAETLSDIKIGLFNDLDDPPNGSAAVSFDYNFYNGNGTWRGAALIYLTFVGAEGNKLATIDWFLDRGHCVYGQGEHRHRDMGIGTNIIRATAQVQVAIGDVTGVQTPC